MKANEPIKLVLDYVRPQSWNAIARMHWTQYEQHVAEHHWLMRAAIGQTADYFTKPADISVVSYFDKRPFDSSNVAVKLFEDGLKNFVIVDDDPRYVRRVSSESRIDRKHPRVEIAITPALPVDLPHPPKSMVIVIDGFRPQSWNRLLRMPPLKWHQQVTSTKSAVLGALSGVDLKMFTDRVDIAVNLFVRNKPMDSSNVPLKLFEDGLLRLIIRDDSPKYVRRVTTMSAVSNKPRVEIIITPTGERR